MNYSFRKKNYLPLYVSLNWDVYHLYCYISVVHVLIMTRLGWRGSRRPSNSKVSEKENKQEIPGPCKFKARLIAQLTTPLAGHFPTYKASHVRINSFRVEVADFMEPGPFVGGQQTLSYWIMPKQVLESEGSLRRPQQLATGL
jgi:hypothetical protein